MTNIRNLVLAFLITLIAGIAIFCIFKALFNVDDKVAQGAAAIPLTALPKVYEELEKSSARNSRTASGKLIESLDEFGVRWQIMVLCGTLIFVGIQNGLSIYSGAVYGFIAQATGGQLFITGRPTAVFMVAISFPILIVSLYLIRIPGEGLGLDSCAVAKRVGWCAMSRGGRPWRELLVI